VKVDTVHHPLKLGELQGLNPLNVKGLAEPRLKTTGNQGKEAVKLKIALVQFARLPEKRENLEKMLRTLRGIRGVDLVCLPEVWLGGDILSPRDAASLLSQLGKAAKAGGFHLLAGAFFLRRGGQVYSTAPFLGREGEVLGFSDKLFPSQAVGERAFCSPGRRLPVFQVKGTGVGAVVCVDALYPEVSRSLALRGARVLLNPSNIPEDRLALWRHVAAARAAENTVFYAFVNNTATAYSDGRRVEGGSFIVSPQGQVVAQAGGGEECLKVKLDLASVNRVRKRWPYLADVQRLRRRQGFFR